MIYYVYVYLDTRKSGNYIYNDLEFDYEPFYVGRGKNYRCTDGCKYGGSLFKRNKINKIIKDGYEPKIIKIYEKLDYESSVRLEIETISKIGRYDLNSGPLVNLTDGGEGLKNISEETKKKIGIAQKGKIISIETRNKISKASLGRIVSIITRNKISKSKIGKPGKCTPHTDETKDKIRKSMIGEKHHMYGKKHKLESIKKMSMSRLGKSPSNKGISCKEETKIKISNSLKGEKNFNYGKHFSDEHKRKISESNKKPQMKPIYQYSLSDEFIKEYESILSASIETNINKSIIGKCCRGLGQTAGGFKWKFKYENNNNRIC